LRELVAFTHLWVFFECVVQGARCAFEHAWNVRKRQASERCSVAAHRSGDPVTTELAAGNRSTAVSPAVAITRPVAVPARAAITVVEGPTTEELLWQGVGQRVGNRTWGVRRCRVAREVLLIQHPLARAVICPTVEWVGALGKARAS
jgi:hypothetical protein